MISATTWQRVDARRVHFNKLCEEQTMCMCVETREMHFSVNNFCCFNYCHHPPKGT